MMPKALLTANGNISAIYSLINLYDASVEIEKPKVHLEEIERPFYVNLRKINNGQTNKQHFEPRLITLHENVRTDHMNSEENNSLITLRDRYKHILHLPNDVLSTTSTLQHEIPHIGLLSSMKRKSKTK